MWCAWGSCGGHSGAALLASTLLCSWRAPKKKWRHDVGHERVPPMIATGSHRFIVRYFQLWGSKDGYVMCLGSYGGQGVAVLLASTLLCSWRAQKKKWMHDVGHERVPPMTVTGSHRYIVQYFQLWGCKDGYVMCLRGPVEDTVWQLCWLSTFYVPGGPQERSGDMMPVMKVYPLWLLKGPTGS